jgi:hypothetical protein
MWVRDFPPIQGPPPYEPDPVIEAYKKDVDRTLIVENLKRSLDERMQQLAALQRFALEVRVAGQRTFGY